VKLDDTTKKLLAEEIKRIMDDCCSSLGDLEKALVWAIIEEEIRFMQGVPNKYKAIIYDILHRYSLVIEGLNKK
jgi:hypothetical protein